ncbi:MAG: hypothetical protein EXR39_06740 [Betaproteobacteria bacterium]|nr:hypothetical protein [Betaproteobacteria bacterium]
MSTSAGVPAQAPASSNDRWNRNSVTVLTICILGWAFDIYEATIMQLVTPILIKEWALPRRPSVWLPPLPVGWV